MGSKKEKPRNYFRLEYPPEVRPKIYIANETHSVINLSEGGVKFEVRNLDLKADKDHQAVIVFYNSDKTEVVGSVIRSDKMSMVLQLSEGVPLQRIMNEQRFLLNKYGTLRQPLDKK